MENKKILVLGYGRMGSFIAKALTCYGHSVSVIDKKIKKDNHKKEITDKITFIEGTYTKEQLKEYDLIVGALPSYLGFQTLKDVIEAKRNYVDISYMEENPLQKDLIEQAKKNNITVVVDCGIAPGFANMCIRYAHTRLWHLTSANYYVGGVPKNPKYPSMYKTAWSPEDVVEEYIRPVKAKINGEITTLPPLSNKKIITLPLIGSLEGRMTDGLRTLISSFSDIPNMGEWTLRHFGHFDFIQSLIDHKFFSGKNKQHTTKILKQSWELEENEKEVTVLQVDVAGHTRKIECFVYVENTNNESSMAIATGSVCAVVANLVAQGKVEKRGILAPENLINDYSDFSHVEQELEKHGFKVYITEKEL